MKDIDEKGPMLAEVDDFNDEKDEVRKEIQKGKIRNRPTHTSAETRRSQDDAYNIPRIKVDHLRRPSSIGVLKPDWTERSLRQS